MAKYLTSETIEKYEWGDGCLGWIYQNTDQLSIIKEQMPPGTSETKHYHTKSEQTFFLLSGSLSIFVSGEPHDLKESEALIVSPNEVHEVKNMGDKPAIFILVSSPNAKGDRIER